MIQYIVKEKGNKIYRFGTVQLEPHSQAHTEKEEEHRKIRDYLVQVLGFSARLAFDHLLVTHAITQQKELHESRHITAYRKATKHFPLHTLKETDILRHQALIYRAESLDSNVLVHWESEQMLANQNLLRLFPDVDGVQIHGRYTHPDNSSEVHTHPIGDQQSSKQFIIDLSEHIEFVF